MGRFDDDDDDAERAPRRKKRKKRKRPKRPFALPAWFDFYIAGAALLGVGGLFFVAAALIFPRLAAVPMGLGALLLMGGWLWLLMVAFRDDVTAGIFCMLIPFYGLYYAVSHFDECKRPICFSFVGLILALLGSCVGRSLVEPRGRGPGMRVECEIRRVYREKDEQRFMMPCAG